MENAEDLMMDTFALPDSYMELIEESDLLSDFIRLEDNKRLYIALNSIPEEYATAIYLQYIEKLSIEQTSKIMKKTVK